MFPPCLRVGVFLLAEVSGILLGRGVALEVLCSVVSHCIIMDSMSACYPLWLVSGVVGNGRVCCEACGTARSAVYRWV